MYGKIFESIYDGTLSESWQALITFQQMIVLCDCDGVIDMTPNAISRRTGIPIEHIKAGIEFLEQSDPYSRTTIEEGKRIVRLDDHRPWGWQIVNHAKYRSIASRADKKKADRERIAKKRKENRDVANSRKESQPVANVAYADADANTNKDLKDLLSEPVKPKPKKPPEKTYDPNSIEFGLSVSLFNLILQYDHKTKKPDFNKWAIHIDRLIRLDKRTPQEIEAVIHWCQRDTFWHSNILSTAKLREKFPELKRKMDTHNNRANSKSNIEEVYENNRRVAEELYEETYGNTVNVQPQQRHISC